MADAALYFPYIDVPDSPGLARVLLYWDRVGSIVPQDVSLSPHMQRLVDLGLVAPLDPLKSEIFDRGYSRFRQLESFISEYAERQSMPMAHTARIHSDKGEWRFWRILMDSGLATASEDVVDRHRGWIMVEPRIGCLYMAFLAIQMGQRHGMEPITDQQRYWDVVVQQLGPTISGTLDGARATTLRNVLPAPARPVDPGELAEFKRDHSELLNRMRLHVETELLRCAKEPDAETRRRMVELVSQTLRDDVLEVRKRMSERRWPSAMDACCAALLGVPSFVAGLATGKAAVAATGVVPLAVQIIRAHFDGAQFPDSPLLYAGLAIEAFG